MTKRRSGGKRSESFGEIVRRVESEEPAVGQYFSPVREKAIADAQGRSWILKKSLLSKAEMRSLLTAADVMIVGYAPLGLSRKEFPIGVERQECFDNISADYLDDEPIGRNSGDLVYYGYEFRRASDQRLLYIEQECIP